jgi:DNA-binding NarL/FixJ family response regulator
MEKSPQQPMNLKVLLVGNAGVASSALSAWLAEQENLVVCNPAGSTAQVIAFAMRFQPHVVLLDFHGLPVSTAYTIRLLKTILPAPAVFVLTHDASPAMRRRCRDARADAVFEKTAELDALSEALAALRRPTAPADA